VGSYAAEALARSAVGHLTLVDFDSVCITNLNRQLHATRSTVGQSKAELMGERVRAIHPKGDVRVISAFYAESNSDEILDQPYDAVLDCIDNMTAKLHLLETCVARQQPVWSAMGAGGRMDPTRIRVSPLSETHQDPFARIVRHELRARGIEQGVTAVWSDEPPNDLDAAVQAGFRCICPDRANSPHSCDKRLQVQGSVAWLPSVFGLVMAGAVANHIVGKTLHTPKPVGRAHHRQRPSQNKPSRARKRELMAKAGLLDLQPVSRRSLLGED
jgi:tRNA A37 threonylcarbamoyladenosine dehydratase